jgi:predicted membrane protein
MLAFLINSIVDFWYLPFKIKVVFIGFLFLVGLFSCVWFYFVTKDSQFEQERQQRATESQSRVEEEKKVANAIESNVNSLKVNVNQIRNGNSNHKVNANDLERILQEK